MLSRWRRRTANGSFRPVGRRYLQYAGIDRIGGIPTRLMVTGELWDDAVTWTRADQRGIGGRAGESETGRLDYLVQHIARTITQLGQVQPEGLPRFTSIPRMPRPSLYGPNVMWRKGPEPVRLVVVWEMRPENAHPGLQHRLVMVGLALGDG